MGLISKSKQGFYPLHSQMFEEMLLCDSVRGTDSTGVFGVLTNTQVRLLKVASSAGVFVQNKKWTNFKEMMVREMRTVVGHNRAATKGLVINEHAHPFHKDNIILVHNGTLTNHKDIADTIVDSEAIAHGFAEKGYKETLKELQGAWALVWYDMTAKKLFMARNHERPLAITETSDYFGFASEGHMLGWITSREGRTKPDKIQLLKANVIYEISINPFDIQEIELQEKQPPVVIEHKPVVRPVSQAVALAVNDMTDEQLLKEYNNGETVVFLPNSVEKSKHPHERFKATGHVYLPGKLVATATCWMPETLSEEDSIELCAEGRLTAVVQTVMLSQLRNLHLVLINPHSDVWIKTWNDEELICTEWHELCRKHVCKSCSKPLDKLVPDLTSVTMKDGVIKSAKCSDCVLANYEHFPEELKAKANDYFAACDTTLQDSISVS